jgi:hypothetical protein
METMASPSLPALLVAWMPLLALLAPGCEGGVRTTAGPLAVARPTVDRGRVFEGTVLEEEWELRVRASAAVSEAKTDCGCTLVRLERGGPMGRAAYELGSPLAAGERLYVRVRYDTRGRRGPAPRAVTLSLAGAGVQVLTLEADVEPWLRVEPELLPFERVLEGQGAACTFALHAASGAPFGLRATGVALPRWVSLELAPEAPDAAGRARRWRVHGRLLADAPRGTFAYPLELASDEEIPAQDPRGEPRFFTVAPTWRLQVLGPVALSTPNLEFGVVRADETVAQSLRLESFDPGFTPDAATARLEPLEAGVPFPLGRTARVRTLPAGKACDIELVLAGLDREVVGTFLARLVVDTGHPALPRLEALVRGVGAPADDPRRSGGVR